MEGVEDIPGAALAEGIRWNWESFPQFMDALDATPHSLDFLVQVPHDPVRMAVMGERAFTQQAAGADDIAAMRALVREALRGRRASASAPAAATTTARPKAARRRRPRRRAAELTGIAGAFEGLAHGVIQMVSDFDVLKGPERFDAEFDLVEQVARAAGRPLSMTWLQRDPGGAQWQAIRERVDARGRARAAALPAGGRARHRRDQRARRELPSVHGLSRLQGDRRACRSPSAPRRCAIRRARRACWPRSRTRVAGDGTRDPAAGRHPARADRADQRPHVPARRPTPDYEPTRDAELPGARQAARRAARSRRSTTTSPRATATNLIYFPIFNYNDGSLAAVRQHARASARAGRPERCRRARRHGLRRELLDLHADALGARPRRGPAAARARGRDDDARATRATSGSPIAAPSRPASAPT